MVTDPQDGSAGTVAVIGSGSGTHWTGLGTDGHPLIHRKGLLAWPQQKGITALYLEG
jgi:hypothetical protein